VVLRFGRASDLTCLQQDHIVCLSGCIFSVRLIWVFLFQNQFFYFFKFHSFPNRSFSLIQLSKAARDVSKFATVALVDVDSEDIQVYVKYFDITLIPSTVFFFNAHHMKMDYGYGPCSFAL